MLHGTWLEVSSKLLKPSCCLGILGSFTKSGDPRVPGLEVFELRTIIGLRIEASL